MLASIECAKCFSIINCRAIINVLKGLSFNLFNVDLSLKDWCFLLFVLIGSPKAAIYSGLSYLLVLICFYYLCSPFT